MLDPETTTCFGVDERRQYPTIRMVDCSSKLTLPSGTINVRRSQRELPRSWLTELVVSISSGGASRNDSDPLLKITWLNSRDLAPRLKPYLRDPVPICHPPEEANYSLAQIPAKKLTASGHLSKASTALEHILTCSMAL
jgi:hypothetical protein